MVFSRSPQSSAIVTIAALFGFRFWQHAQRYEETDDAYVTGHSHPLSFRVNGTVSEVSIDDNQLVKQSQPLTKLDPRDFEVQLHQAEASLQQSQAQLKRNEAQINQARAQLEQARAQADASKAKFSDSLRVIPNRARPNGCCRFGNDERAMVSEIGIITPPVNPCPAR